jgi:ribosomal protein L37AE/L43A
MILCKVCKGNKVIRNGAEIKICPGCQGQGSLKEKGDVAEQTDNGNSATKRLLTD